jgi:hypothetical protein
MKDYGRDGKKRKFKAIMNTSTKGIYSGITPLKEAKKVTSEHVGKKKNIIFTLREKGKSLANLYGPLINSQSKIINGGIIDSQANLYGPYIGSIKDGKAIIRINKMRGGDLIDCVFNNIKINNFKVNSKNPAEIKISKFCFTMATIIFFDFLQYNQKKYYKYAIYREEDKIFIIELEISDDKKLEIRQIRIQDIKKDFLEKIMGKIKEKQRKNPKFALKIQKKIQDRLDSIKNHEQKIFNSPEKFFSQPKNTVEKNFNRRLHQSVQNVKINLPRTLIQQSIKILQKPPPINNSEKQFLKFFICPIENFAEVRQNAYNQIVFGFDPRLFMDNLYYKYLYFGNNTFRELVKNDRGYFDISITLTDIPLYDLLCLMEFAKLNNIGELFKLVIDNINLRKKNGLFTISLSDHSFSELKNSNYNKKRTTNVGKIKKQDFTKTYYFFGEYTPNNFKYACYRLDEKVYYFEIGSNMKERLLEELKDRNAIQELKSFIILRSLDTNDPKFGERIYPKVSEIIHKLKLEELQISTKNQISILPISSKTIIS